MAPSTRLHLRFAAATAAVIAVTGGALLWYVSVQETSHAEHDVTAHAQYAARAILQDELRPSDLARPVTGRRLQQLDRLFRGRVLSDGGLRVKLYRAGDGIVTYSDEHLLIGTPTDDPSEIAEVTRGKVVRDVTHLNKEGGTGSDVKALEVYVPITLRGQTRPAGVFELYQSYAPVAASVHSFLVPFAFLLLGALLFLWVALFPLVQRMVRLLDRSRALQHTTARELEETSEQLRQSQKMDAIGRLAGGVAHDFNNLLLAINGYAELLEGALRGEREQRYAKEIRSAGERAAELTHQLLAFSRKQKLQPRVLDLNATVREFDGMLRRMIGHGVRIVLDLDPSLRAVEADPGQVGQVLLNLAVNSRDAMAGSGTLKITTRNDGGDVLLEVADSGFGMDEETLSRIFEPFFTTKEVGAGTGLGLSTVYGIVAQSGGTVPVRSAPGAGTTFKVRLPGTDEVPERPAGVHRDPRRGGERILVVDDEQVLRELLAQLLRDQGYDVTVAGSAREARAIDGPWDLAITDVVMPETGGVELAGELDARTILFISGYAQEALADRNDRFLQKPFDRDALMRTVRELLDEPALV